MPNVSIAICLFVRLSGRLHEYPVIPPMRRLIEKILGFSPLNPDLAQRTEQ